MIYFIAFIFYGIMVTLICLFFRGANILNEEESIDEKKELPEL